MITTGYRVHESTHTCAGPCREQAMITTGYRVHESTHTSAGPCREQSMITTGYRVHESTHTSAGPCREQSMITTGYRVHESTHTSAGPCWEQSMITTGYRVHESTHTSAGPCREQSMITTGYRVHESTHTSAGPCREQSMITTGYRVHESTHTSAGPCREQSMITTGYRVHESTHTCAGPCREQSMITTGYNVHESTHTSAGPCREQSMITTGYNVHESTHASAGPYQLTTLQASFISTMKPLYLLIILCLQSVSAGTVIEIQFKQYRSSCREDGNTNNCDPKFTFCLDKPKSSYSISSCYYGAAGESGYYQNMLNIDFDSSIRGIPNPWIIVTKNMESSLMLVIRIRDDDIFGDDHLATWPTTLTEPVYPSKDVAQWSSKTTSSGNFIITFDVRIYCEANSYSPSCSVSCLAQDTATGHYTCNQTTGSKICFKGWTGVNCEVDINECSEAVCQNGGTCENAPGGYTCHCLSQFQGKNCSTLRSVCDSSPCLNNGTCNSTTLSSYSCKCSPFYRGVNCETRQDPCLTVTCKNNGSCRSNANLTNYWCDCSSSFNGSHCEYYIGGLTTTVNSSLSGVFNTTSTSLFVGEEIPTHVEDAGSGGIGVWLIILICVLASVFIIILLVIAFIWRHKREKANRASKETPSFINGIYCNENLKNGHNQVLPSTPTDDDLFNPFKPPPSDVFNESPTVTDGQYADMDADGYVKPHVLSRSPFVERAHSNQYDDFKNVSLRQDTLEEPHYEDLDEVRLNANRLQGDSVDNTDQKVLMRDINKNCHYSSAPKNTPITLPRNADNVFHFLVPDQLEDVVLPDSKPPSPVYFAEEEVDHGVNKLFQPLEAQQTGISTPDMSRSFHEEMISPIQSSDPFAEPVAVDDLNLTDVDLPEIISHQGCDVPSTTLYTMAFPHHESENDKDETHSSHDNECNVSNLTKPPPVVAPKPTLPRKVNTDIPIVFQNPLFGQQTNSGNNGRNHPSLAADINVHQATDVRNSDIFEDVHLAKDYDAPNSLFYKFDFKKDEVEEVVYDNHTAIKSSPESQYDSPMSTLTRTLPPISPKPTLPNKEISNLPISFHNAVFGDENNLKQNFNSHKSPSLITNNDLKETSDVRNSSCSSNEDQSDVHLTQGYDIPNSLFYKLDFKKDEIEEVVYDNHTAIKLSPESQYDSPMSTLTRTLPPPVSPKPKLPGIENKDIPTTSQQAMQVNNSNDKDLKETSHMRNSSDNTNEDQPDVHLTQGCDPPNSLFYKLDFKKDEIEEVVYDNHTSIKSSPESQYDSPMSTLNRTLPPLVSPKPPLPKKEILVSADKLNMAEDDDFEDCPQLIINEDCTLTNTINNNNPEKMEGIFIQNPNYSFT
ncbi:hypothetical protein Btru_054758 [Bulinus truncatus]|nr:hypothetical protein Btru_054758 [Bulinus truncatus]